MVEMTRNLVLVKLKDEEDSIVLPDSVKMERAQKATQGTAVAVGPDCEYVKEGEIVHYRNYVGNELDDKTLGKGVFIVVAEDDIMAHRKA